MKPTKPTTQKNKKKQKSPDWFLFGIEDGYVGSWLNDLYELTYLNDGQIQRLYSTMDIECNSPIISNYTKKSTKKGPIKRKFTYESIVSINSHKFRGRNWYWQSPSLNHELSPFILEYDKNCSEFYTFNGKPFDLASFICTKASNYSNSVGTFEMLLKNPNPCHKVSYKVASSLIRVAATRIFSEPEQSIMELPVNSSDSYCPNSKTGKFGMGFYSMLWWLVGNPNRVLQIESAYYSNGFGSYVCKIQEIDKKLTFTIYSNPKSQITELGTVIYLYCGKGSNLTNTNVINISKQIEKLRLMPSINIIYSPRFFNKYNEISSQSQSNRNKDLNYSIVGYGTNGIVVEDYAAGIPLTVLLDSLLIPSISTKTIKESLKRNEQKIECAYITKKIQKGNSELINRINSKKFVPMSAFYIAVNNIIIYKSNRYSTASSIINFPPSTRLPVSRDDIIIDDNQSLIDTLLELASYNALDSSLYYLQLSLRDYIEFTASTENKNLFSFVLNEIGNIYKSNLIPFDDKYLSLIHNSFIYSMKDYVNYFELEKFVLSLKIHDDTIWENTNVITINTTKNILTNFGSLLFISTSNKSKGWVENITSSFVNRNLTPKSSSKKSDIEKVFKSILAASDQRKFNLKYQEDPGFWLSFTPEQKEMILFEYSISISNYKGNETYGGCIYPLKIIFRTSHIFELLGKFKMDFVLCFARFTTKSDSMKMQGKYFLFDIFVREFSELLDAQNTPMMIEKITDFETFMFFVIFYYREVPKLQRDSFSKNPMVFESFIRICCARIAGKKTVLENYLSTFLNFLSKTTKEHAANIFAQKLSEIIFVSANHTVYPPNLLRKTNNDVSFTINQLISYVFHTKKEIESFDDLVDVKNITEFIPFQLIDIVVNEGTTKDPIDATITELIQNSLDATKMANLTTDILIDKLITDEFIILSIKDGIGMGFESFLSMGIPFLSTKTNLKGVTGEMGSGFFNVYRNSSKVVITTYHSGVCYRSIDVPIIVDGRVQDVKKTITKSLDATKKGTQIEIFYAYQNQIKKAELLASISAVCNSYLPSMVSSSNIIVDGNHILAPKTLVYESEAVDCYVHGLWSSYPCLILTNGVPFSPMDISDTCGDETGLVINIKQGYTPVHSRTKINIPDPIKQSYQKALMTGVFYRAANFYHTHGLIHNAKSKNDPAQLKFTEIVHYFYNNESDVFYYYPITDDGKSFVKLINEAIDTGVNAIQQGKTPEEAMDASFENPINIQNENVLGLVSMILSDWFGPKKYLKEKVGVAGVPEFGGGEKKSGKLLVVVLEGLMDFMIKRYYKIAKELRCVGFDREPPKFEYSNESTILGLYEPKSHTLKFNVDSFQISDINSFLLDCCELNQVQLLQKQKNNPFFNTTFEETSVTSTFPHELEHARVGHDHNSQAHSPHGILRVKLFEGESIHTYTFSERTNHVYNIIKRNGFWKDVVEFMKGVFYADVKKWGEHFSEKCSKKVCGELYLKSIELKGEELINFIGKEGYKIFNVDFGWSCEIYKRVRTIPTINKTKLTPKGELIYKFMMK